MKITTNRPLVTFFVCAYKQENYIRRAIEGALNQTYSPLQIILSDDCSTDQTFAIMKEMAAEYHGPHTVILNQNERNLGVCAHVNRVCELASGQWVVASAGDDISMPERAVSIMRALENAPDATYFLSQAYKFSGINPNDTPFLPLLDQPIGATEAFRLDVFREFGPLLPATYSEDWALYFRGQLVGKVLFLRHPLVYYRVAADSLTDAYFKGSIYSTLEIHLKNLLQFRSDFAQLPSNLQSAKAATRNGIEMRITLIRLFGEVKTGERSLRSALQRILGTRECTITVRLSLGILMIAPGLFLKFERLRRSRLNMLSPTQHAIGYLNPLSLLEPPIYV